MLAKNITIRNGDSHSIVDIENDLRINNAKPVNIKKHVWIGEGATVLKGVTVGPNCIIGTKSIVTLSIPKNCAVVGSANKIARNNISWKRERT